MSKILIKNFDNIFLDSAPKKNKIDVEKSSKDLISNLHDEIINANIAQFLDQNTILHTNILSKNF